MFRNDHAHIVDGGRGQEPTVASGRRAPDRLRTFDRAVAVVTGGGSGIGRALAESLAARGARVAVADRDGTAADRVAADIGRGGGMAVAVEVDVVDFSAVLRAVDGTHARWGRLDFLFNNAGISIGGEVRHHRIEDWNYVIDVNLRGVVNGIQAAYPIMLRQGFGHIVNTASLQGLIPTPTSVSYAATKHAIVGLSKSLRAEAAPAGIRISVVCPGLVDTAILRGGRFGRLLQPIPDDFSLWGPVRPIDPARFARRVLPQIARNKAIIVVPGWWKVFWWLDRASPTLGMRLAQGFFERTARRLATALARDGGAGVR
jgi:NAD(P)-dependent dehydrogenase (short-subunit alcohol dehydrogenase family)